jgi:hypothetical protein
MVKPFLDALENLEGDSVVTFIFTVGECTRCKGRLFLLLLTLAMLDVDRESRSYNGIRMSLDLNKKSTLYILTDNSNMGTVIKEEVNHIPC